MRCPEDGGDEGTQKGFEPPDEEAEVVAGGGEDGVGAVAAASPEMVAAHAVAVLDVADHRLDRGAALHLPAAARNRPGTPR